MSESEENSFAKAFDKFKSFFGQASSETSASESIRNDAKLLKYNISQEKIDAEIKEMLSKQSGMDRVKELFRFDEVSGKRPDIYEESVDMVTSIGVVSFFLGSILRAAQKDAEFKRNTQLTVYTNKKAAARQYADYVYLQTLKGGGAMAVKYMSFTGTIIGTSLMLQAYRNKSSPFDYTVGGAFTGALFRMHYGLYNFVAGAVAGGIVGTLFGILRYSQLRLMGQTYEERKYNSLKEQIVEREIMIASMKNQKEKEKETPDISK